MEAAVRVRRMNWAAMMRSDLNLKLVRTVSIWAEVAFSDFTKLLVSSCSSSSAT